MASLTKAFEHMDQRGLIAIQERFCDQCASWIFGELATKLELEKSMQIGYVYVGARQSKSIGDTFEIPLPFGIIEGNEIYIRQAGSLPIGDVICECLEEEGIDFKWDRNPTSQILVKANSDLEGIPELTNHYHDDDDDEDIDDQPQIYAHPELPDHFYDRVGSNPVRLLNIARAQRNGIALPLIHGPLVRPRRGDIIKLGFHAGDAPAPRAFEVLGDFAHKYRIESMWVEVTKLVGPVTCRKYRGELTNAPVFIDPAKLRVGSPVVFTSQHIYPLVLHADAKFTKHSSRKQGGRS